MEEFSQNVESVDASIERICDEGKRSGNFDALKKARREGSPEAVLRGVVQIIVAEKTEETLEGEEEDEEEEWTANIPQNSTIFNLFEGIESGDDNLEHTDIFWSE